MIGRCVMFEMCRAKSDNSKVSAKAALVTLRTLHHSVQFCFTSTEAVGTVRDGESRTATSTFTQLRNSVAWRAGEDYIITINTHSSVAA